jgi:hypothetical protein
MNSIVTLPKQEQRIVLEPVYSKDFINVYDIGSALDGASVIADAEKGDWIDSTIVAHGEQQHRPDNRDSVQQNFSSINSQVSHFPLLRYSSKCLENYLEMFPQANNFSSFAVNEHYNIIRYKPGQAYHSAHSDFYPNFNSPLSRRHLTGICLLNDIEAGGDLEFPQQDLSIKAEAGKFVIFPSGWTHAHRTLPPVGRTRYIFQLWWSFS